MLKGHTLKKTCLVFYHKGGAEMNVFQRPSFLDLVFGKLLVLRKFLYSFLRQLFFVTSKVIVKHIDHEIFELN